MKKLSLFALTMSLISIAHGQINYTVDEANAIKWENFAHAEVSSHLLGTTGLGFSAGAQAQYKFSLLPVTLAGRFRYEAFGLASVEQQGEAYGPSRNLELAAMIPIIPGRSKPSKVKVTTLYEASNTSTYEEYFYANGEKKNELLARLGLFRYWTKGSFSSSGVAAGVTFRMRKHVDVSLSNEEGYHREVFSNKQLYADILYAPIIDSFYAEGEDFTLGGRVGFLRAASSGANYYTELEFRPGIIATLTFGLLFGWERL